MNKNVADYQAKVITDSISSYKEWKVEEKANKESLDGIKKALFIPKENHKLVNEYVIIQHSLGMHDPEDPLSLGNPPETWNPDKLTRVFRDVKDAIQALRIFGSEDLILPYIEELDRYGIHVNVDSNGEEEKMQINSYGDSAKSVQKYVDRQIEFLNGNLCKAHRAKDRVNKNGKQLCKNGLISKSSDFQDAMKTTYVNKAAGKGLGKRQYTQAVDRHEKAVEIQKVAVTV